MRPLRDWIEVKPDEVLEHVTSSGIVLKARNGIHTSQEQLGRTGTVIAIGPGKITRKGENLPLIVEPGQKVIFGEFEYPKIDGNILIQEADICAVIES